MYRVEGAQRGFWNTRKVMILRQSGGLIGDKVKKPGFEGTELYKQLPCINSHNVIWKFNVGFRLGWKFLE